MYVLCDQSNNCKRAKHLHSCKHSYMSKKFRLVPSNFIIVRQHFKSCNHYSRRSILQSINLAFVNYSNISALAGRVSLVKDTHQNEALKLCTGGRQLALLSKSKEPRAYPVKISRRHEGWHIRRTTPLNLDYRFRPGSTTCWTSTQSLVWREKTTIREKATTADNSFIFVIAMLN